MTKKRKNGLFRFCFSCIPGAGEMYLGFMKMGLSLMILFWGLIGVYAVLNVDILIFMLVPIWFYSFFHVHNLAGLSDEEFRNTKDEYLMNLDTFFMLDKWQAGKYRKLIAVILIWAGVVLLWNSIADIMIIYFPEKIWRLISSVEYTASRMLIAIGIIIAGVYMIRGKRQELKEETAWLVTEEKAEYGFSEPEAKEKAEHSSSEPETEAGERSSHGEEC